MIIEASTLNGSQDSPGFHVQTGAMCWRVCWSVIFVAVGIRIFSNAATPCDGEAAEVPSASSNGKTETNEMCGVGIALTKGMGGFVVTQIVSNSPAASIGSVAEGDLITAVAQDGAPPVSLKGIERVEQAVGLIRGPKASVVRLTIVPSGTNVAQTKVVSLVRGELKGLRVGGLWLNVLTNGAPAPEVSFTGISDRQVRKTSDFRGKAVVLEFWATWCGPCIKLMPQLQSQAAKFESRRGFAWVCASIDDAPEPAAALLRARGWNHTINVWADKSVVQAFGLSGVPHMVIIAQNGKVLYSGSPLTGPDLEKILRAN